MTDDEIVRAAAASLGLEIDAAHWPGVVANMAILRRHARLVLDFRVDEQEECTGEFRA